MRYTLLSILSMLMFMFPSDAGIIISDEPYLVIAGEHTLLHLPESVAFTPSGDCIAVANLWGRRVTLYKRIDGSSTHYDSTPFTVLTDPANLRDPHEAKFTPDGKYLAVVSRGVDKAPFYPLKKNSACTYLDKPAFVLKESSKLANPSSLDFSPSGNILGIANRWGAITFFKRKGGEYSKSPYQMLPKNLFYHYGIASPHAIAFSPDGQTVATLHKRYAVDSNPQGKSALVVFEKDGQKTDKFKSSPAFISFAEQIPYHSLAFHPTGKYLAVTDGTHGMLIFEKNGGQNAYEHIYTVTAEPESSTGEGPKGVAFSPDGKILAITTVSPYGVRFYDVQVTD